MRRWCGVLLLLAGLTRAGDQSLEGEVEHYLAQTEPAPLQPSWANRMRFESADGRFRSDLIGWIMWDNKWAASEEFASPNATFFRSVRLGLQGHAFREAVYKIQLELATAEVGLRDVFVGLGRDGPSVIAGHFKEPFGLEFLTPLSAIFFLERSEPTRAFVPDRNSGIMLSSSDAYNLGPRPPGEGWFQRRVSWAVGCFRTSDNKGRSSGNGGYSVTARVSALALDRPDTLLHFGLAYTYRRDRSVRYAADHGLVDTGAMAVAASSRFGYEVAFTHHGLSVSAELFLTAEDQAAGANTSFIGGYVEIGTWLTGERQQWNIDRFITTGPTRTLLDGHGGVWIGYRFDHLDLNDGAIRGGEQSQHTVGVNWAWNWNMRVMLNYTYIDIASGPDGAGTSHAVSIRTQFNF